MVAIATNAFDASTNGNAFILSLFLLRLECILTIDFVYFGLLKHEGNTRKT